LKIKRIDTESLSLFKLDNQAKLGPE